MSTVALKKTVEVEVEDKATVLTDVKVYARKIWLAGLGAYAKAGQEGFEYFKDLVKNGEGVAEQGKKQVSEQVELHVTANVNSVKGKVEVQLDKIEKAFDARVASALNRIGIPSRQDVAALATKLDELSAMVEQAAQTK
jgi:poly(hydroxyalkanoate) granule-associated protein